MKSTHHFNSVPFAAILLSTAALLPLSARAEVFTEGKQMPVNAETQRKPGFKVFGPGEVSAR